MIFSQVPLHDWGQFVTTVGVPTALLFIVLWFIKHWLAAYMQESKIREERMALRINKLEDFQHGTLITLLNECRGALVESTDVIKELHSAVITSNEEVRRLITQMLERPCLLPHHGKPKEQE